jgi:hypothetical protein
MQQRQFRLGDILDDYCPRERRVTITRWLRWFWPDVKQIRCTTCDAEHEYKHARCRVSDANPTRLPRSHSQVLANGPKRVIHEGASANGGDHSAEPIDEQASDEAIGGAASEIVAADHESDNVAGAPMNMTKGNGHDRSESAERDVEASKPLDGESTEPLDDESLEPSDDEGPVHRPLIRASLPRPEGQPPPTRPLPEFTIRQPGGRQNRFRPRHQRGGPQQFQGNRSNGGGSMTGPPRGMRPSGGRPPQGTMPSRLARRNGPPGRKRSK